MSDIFISYANEDKGRVQALARALEQKGWSVWWDRRIPVGQSYAEVIEEALDVSKAVVVVWTTASVKSQWVKNEALEGLNRRVLFPVMLEAVKIPLEFRHVQAARLMDWQPGQEHAGFDQFLDDLIGVIGAPVVKSQATPASSIKQTPEPATGLLQGAVRAVLISGNNNLSGLTLSMGTLEPAFAGSTTDYIVNVASDVSSINISATKADPDAVLSGGLTIESGTATGQATIQLNGPGTVTPVLFTVTASNGSSKTYRIMVNRAALSGNNNLSALRISPGSLSPAFNTSTLNYTVEVASTVTSLSVTPTPQDASADMTVNGQVTDSGQARTIVLSGPGSSTLINIVVTALNGAQKTYTLAVSRAVLRGNNNLSALTVTPPGSISPAFTESTTKYTANVGSGVTSVTVEATKADADAVMSGDVSAGSGIATGQATIPLSGPGTTTGVTIWVTAPGGAQQTYMLHVFRAALSGNNNLQSVHISPGTLVPSFSANSSAYTVNVGDSVTSVTLTPTLQDDNSSITINGHATGSGQTRVISLGPAGTGTEIGITVIAENGSEKTYRISVNRAALPEAAEVEQEPERHEQQSPTAVTEAMSRDSSVAAPSLTGATEREEVDSEFAQVGEDRLNESIGVRQSTDSFPYLPIGLGLLVVMGALVYFLFFSQGPSPGTRDVAQYQPSVQSPTTRSEALTLPPATEPNKQPSAATPQEEPTVKQRAVSAKKITGKDGAPMVLVSAGEFMMGFREGDKDSGNDERPAHPVYLDPFYIDQYEVTTSRYATFFQETNRATPEYWSAQVLRQHGRKPVVGVDWNDAVAYCSWAGKRLPTEAEWEKAARGTDQRLYPWGNAPPSEKLANVSFGVDFKDYGVLTDVGSFETGKSPYSAYDMAGNVWEWVADWYDDAYYDKSPARNPRGPLSGELRMIRGGSWSYRPGYVRSAGRGKVRPTDRADNIGFRCAQDVPK